MATVFQRRHIVVSRQNEEYIEAQMEERGVSASEVIREALDFKIRYDVKPEIMRRLMRKIDRDLEKAVVNERDDSGSVRKKIAA